MSSLLELNRALRPYVRFGHEFPPICCAPEVSLDAPWPEVQSDRVLRNTLINAEMFRRLSEDRMRMFEASIRELADLLTVEIEARW